MKINKSPLFHRFCKPSEESRRQKQVAQILEKLITLTIEETEMYPSVQAKIWGSIGHVPELIDMVLDSFIQRSVNSGEYSYKITDFFSGSIRCVANAISLP